ncbi:MAG: ATP-dependent helicase [Actinomycetota bacterium]
MFVDTTTTPPAAEAPHLAGLDDDQLRAVTHGAGPLLIVAGAGTGKTRTLTARLAHLLTTGVPADRILLLTFSRRAAAELVERAGQMAGAGERVRGGTFHATATWILREHGSAVGVNPNFTVLDAGDAVDLIGVVRTELGLAERGRRFPTKDTIAAIAGRVATSLQPLSDTVRRHFPWCEDHLDDLRAVLAATAQRKRRLGVLDFDDLLLHWRALLATPAGAAVVERFDHLLVDEYQDTSPVQADVLEAMAGERRSITVVGDDAQAIYGFRAATAENLRRFPERFPGTTVVTLERNFRSTQPLLDAANEVLAAGATAFERRLVADRTGGSRPTLTTCLDEGAQARWVCDRVLAEREAGMPLRDQAVLVRAAHHSAGLELELAARDIPFVKFGGLRFVESAHVKDLVATLRVLENPADELAWHRMLRLLDGVGPATVRRACDELGVGADDLDPDEALRRFCAGEPELPAAAVDEAAELRAALADGRTLVSPATQIDRLLGFFERVMPRVHDAAPTRIADLHQLAELAGAAPTRARFLADLVLDPPSSTSELAGPPHLDDDWLTISTIHSAKGLEWRAVHLLHAADGCLPSDMALGEPDGLDEERRLLYVALTRARDRLHVTYPVHFHIHRFGRDDRHAHGQLSRFLQPIRHHFDDDVAGAPGHDEALGGVADDVDPVGDLLGSLWEA